MQFLEPDMRRLLPLSLLMPAIALSAGQPAIPPAVWALKDNPAYAKFGAVVVEDRVTFKNTYVEYRRLIRIFAEAGRHAAEFESFSEDSYDFEGRTVYPDGKSVPFTKRKDFASKSVGVGDRSSSRTVLIPPGVTTDCVVELTWKESAAHRYTPLPARTMWYTDLTMANAVPTRECIVDVPTNFPFAYAAFPSRTIKPEMVVKGSMRSFIYRDVPAMDELPYGMNVTRDFPHFYAYYMPDPVRSVGNAGGAKFWNEAGRAFFGVTFDKEVSKGSRYKSFYTEIWAGLNGSPAELAAAAMTRLDARIRNLSYATYSEAGSVKKKESEEEIHSSDLEETLKRGATDSLGMTVLYLQLLRDRGLAPKLVLASDRDYTLFKFNMPNVYQFHGYLVAVSDPARGTVWFQPGRRFIQPGLIHPDYQGTPALMLDTKEWTASEFRIPAQPAEANQREYQYQVFPEEGADRFTVKAAFMGYPEYAERTRYMALEPKEQTRKLKEQLESYLKSATFTKVEVIGAQDPNVRVSWVAEGSVEREEGRTRQVSPFPTMAYALYIPDEWPAERVDPIVIPYMRVQTSTSTVHLPEGWKWEGNDSYRKQNRFGTVNWTATSTPDKKVVVTLKVEAVGFFAGADAYADLREFLGWVREASGRTLILQKSR
jgi:hypothetical protein